MPCKRTTSPQARLWAFAGGEEGASLIEVLVAAALLVTVLLPVSAVGVRLVTEDPAALRMEALARGEAALEAMVGQEALVGRAAMLGPEAMLRPETHSPLGTGRAAPSPPEGRGQGPWRLERGVRREGPVVSFRVAVFRGEAPDPVLVLETARYRP
jgi:hypothetical protein